jgi:hypothetical protein
VPSARRTTLRQPTRGQICCLVGRWRGRQQLQHFLRNGGPSDARREARRHFCRDTSRLADGGGQAIGCSASTKRQGRRSVPLPEISPQTRPESNPLELNARGLDPGTGLVLGGEMEKSLFQTFKERIVPAPVPAPYLPRAYSSNRTQTLILYFLAEMDAQAQAS